MGGGLGLGLELELWVGVGLELEWSLCWHGVRGGVEVGTRAGVSVWAWRNGARLDGVEQVWVVFEQVWVIFEQV